MSRKTSICGVDRRGFHAKVLMGAIAAIGSIGLQSASAALLTGSVSTSPPTTANLTTDGTVDWAIWDYQAAGSGTSGAISNRKSAGSAISAMTAALGTPRGITGAFTPPSYTYIDGTSPLTATAAAIGALTDTSINIVGSGIKVSITGSTTVTEQVKVYVDAFNAVGSMSATLNGATTYVDSTPTSTGSRTGAVYTFNFKPDSAADKLNITYTIGSLNTGGSSNVALQAVSVTTVPEPTSFAMLGMAGMLLLGRRRKAV